MRACRDYRTPFRTLCIIACILTSFDVSAEDTTGTTETQVRERKAIVTMDFIDVRGGPARAYQSRGRLYRNEIVRLRGESGREWVLVVSGKVRGWVPVSAFRFPREKVKADVSPERTRRLTDFEYTKEGRRTHRGQASGSGEGTMNQVPGDSDGAATSHGGIRMGASIGVGYVQRAFESNAIEASRVRQVEANSPALVSKISLDWTLSSGVRLSLDGRDFRLADVAVNYGPDMGGLVDVGIDAQDLEATIGYQHNWSSLSGSLYGSFGWFRQGYREVKPLSLFLSTASVHVGGGVRMAWATDRYEVHLKTGISTAASLEQTPLTSGQGDAFLFLLSTGLKWWFNSGFGMCIDADFHRRATDYTGASTHFDPTVTDGIQNYSRAREKDALLSITTGLLWGF